MKDATDDLDDRLPHAAPHTASSAARFLTRRGAAKPALSAAPILDGFTADQVAFAARAWTMRGEEERQSATIFAEARSLLAEDGLSTEMPEMLVILTQIVSDEHRHSEMCTDLARLFGASSARGLAVQRTNDARTSEGRRRRVVRILLVEGAIGETISSALFNVGRSLAEEPSTKHALSRILRDEVLHARVFWEMLASLRAEFDGAELLRLQREVTLALGAIERAQMLPILKRLERGDRFDPAWATLGALPPARRVDAFYGAIERRVCPALTRLGLDGGRAWEQRYRG